MPFTSSSLPMPLNAFELSVTLSPSEIDSSDLNASSAVTVLLVQPQVLIDGKPLTLVHNPLSANVVTDLADVLLAGEREGTFEPVTCSCGHAGCAGIDDPVHVHHHDGRIDWHFPASYMPRLAARGLAKTDDPGATFSFDAQRYQASVSAAIDQIVRWEAENDRPVVIAAHDLVDPQDIPSVQQLIQRWRRAVR